MMHLRKESVDISQVRDTRAESLEFFMDDILSSTANINGNHLPSSISFPSMRKESVDITLLEITDDDAAASALYYLHSSPMSPPQPKSPIPLITINGSFSIPNAASPLQVGFSTNTLSESTLISLNMDSKSSPNENGFDSQLSIERNTQRKDDNDNKDSGLILNRIRDIQGSSFSMIGNELFGNNRSRGFSFSSFSGGMDFGTRSRAPSIEEIASETLIYLSSDQVDEKGFDKVYRNRSISTDSFMDSLGGALGNNIDTDELDIIVRPPNIITVSRPSSTSQTNQKENKNRSSSTTKNKPLANASSVLSRSKITKNSDSLKTKKGSIEIPQESRKRSSSFNSSNSEPSLNQDKRLRKRPKSKTIARLRSDDEEYTSDDFDNDDEYGTLDGKSNSARNGKINNQTNNTSIINSNGTNNKTAKVSSTPNKEVLSPYDSSLKTPGGNGFNSNNILKQKRLSSVKVETPGSVGSLNDQAQKIQKVKKKDDQIRIGIYTLDERKKKIEKFLHQRHKRVWQKKIKYNVRKDFADSRLRVKGRFVRKEDEDQLKDIVKMLF